jgi:hypothetical protein
MLLPVFFRLSSVHLMPGPNTNGFLLNHEGRICPLRSTCFHIYQYNRFETAVHLHHGKVRNLEIGVIADIKMFRTHTSNYHRHSGSDVVGKLMTTFSVAFTKLEVTVEDCF